MQIEMIVTSFGSENGINNKPYFSGRIYDVSEELARLFIEKEHARPFSTESTKKFKTDKRPLKDKRLKLKLEDK